MNQFITFYFLLALLSACNEPKYTSPNYTVLPFDLDTFVNRRQVEADWNLQKNESYISYSDTFERYFGGGTQKTKITEDNLGGFVWREYESYTKEDIYNKNIRNEAMGLVAAFGSTGYFSNTCIIHYPPHRFRCWVNIEWAWLLRDTFQYTITDSLDKLIGICTCSNREIFTLPKSRIDDDWRCNPPTEKLQYYDPIMVVKKFHLATSEGKTKAISLKNSAKFKLFKDILDKAKIYGRIRLYKFLEQLNNPEQPNPQTGYNSYKIVFDTFDSRQLSWSLRQRYPKTNNFQIDLSFDTSSQKQGTLLYQYPRSKYILLDYNSIEKLKAWSPCQKEPLEYKEIAAYAYQRKPEYIYFKKYHNGSPNEWYYYFLFYYFDFDENNIAELVDIEVVVPPKFGIHIQ